MSTLAPLRPPAGPPPVRERPEASWLVRLPWRSPEAKAAPSDDLATFCSFLVTLAVAVSLGRLFRGSSWMAYGFGAAAIGHLLSWGLRRLGAGLVLTSVACPLLSLLVAVELVVPQATTFGFPTPYTFQVLGQALTDAQGAFRAVAAPVVPTTGFVAAAVVAVCMTAFLADWAAFRMRTVFEACLPALALFSFTAVLGARSHRGPAVAAFAAAALVFLIVQRASLDSAQTAWFGGRHQGALPSLLATGAVLGAVAVVGALVLGPQVPGSTSKPLLSFKKGAGGSGSSSRSTVSPLVDIQNRLREYDNVEVFSVTAPEAAYWRLTSLDQFDGTIWSSNERYAGNKGALEKPTGTGTVLVQRVTVSALSSIWLPGAYRPTKVEEVGGVSYSPGSASVISKKDTSDGLTYTITSEVPNPSLEALRGAPPSLAGASGLGNDLARHLKVDGPISPRVKEKAVLVARGQRTPYDRAVALQNFFRSDEFTYSLKVPAGHSGSVVDRFLFETKTGYCEQFAGTYALLARLMGLPTRVAVGFQPGTRNNGTFSVKDSDAHAWPEVYIEGIGWTAFEPTPGRGNPQAQDYTGVPYAPTAPEATDPTASTAPTTVPGQVPGAEPTTATSVPTPANEPEPPTVAPTERRNPLAALWTVLRRLAPFLLGLGALAAALGGSAGFVAWERRRRRQEAEGSPDARVHVAWEEALAALALTGIPARPAETVDELLDRIDPPGADLDLATPGAAVKPAHQSLRRLGGAVVQTAFTGRSTSAALAEAAEADRTVIVDACRACLDRRSRILADLDPRPALARLRAERAKSRPRLASPT